MDVKSILRAFRYGQMQTAADIDPQAKRPPTIKFLALALFLGLGLVLLSFWSSPHVMGDHEGGTALEVHSTPAVPTNETASPEPTMSTTPTSLGDGPAVNP